MNEGLDLTKILKDYPEGTKLYSTIYGDVELVKVSQREDIAYPIGIKKSNRIPAYYLAKDGRLFLNYDGECTLFPSKNQKDWSKFEIKKLKFDPKTLKPFDRVLVRDKDSENWNCGFFSHKDASCIYHCRCIGTPYIYCIPYNEETKHLVGTKEEAPEYYRYWED